MANELFITIIGRLTQDVELRFTPSGAAVANLTIAQNARYFDKQTNEWKDKPGNFFRCTIWREAAEAAVEALRKGSAVIAYGEVTSRSYETKEGEKRTVQEIELSNIGADLRWANPRQKTTQPAQQDQWGGGGFGGYNAATQATMNQPAEDPWATPAASGQPPF